MLSPILSWINITFNTSSPVEVIIFYATAVSLLFFCKCIHNIFRKPDPQSWGQGHWDLKSSKICRRKIKSINLKILHHFILESSHSQDFQNNLTFDLEVEVDIWTHSKFSVDTPMLFIGSLLNYRILRLGCPHCPLGQQGNVNTPSAFCSWGVKTKCTFSLIFLHNLPFLCVTNTIHSLHSLAIHGNLSISVVGLSNKGVNRKVAFLFLISGSLARSIVLSIHSITNSLQERQGGRAGKKTSPCHILHWSLWQGFNYCQRTGYALLSTNMDRQLVKINNQWPSNAVAWLLHATALLSDIYW